MTINITYNKEMDTVKPLDLPIKKMVPLSGLMSWSEKRGQINCYIVVYDTETLYMIKQYKNEKTYTNYFKTYKALLNCYNHITR